MFVVFLLTKNCRIQGIKFLEKLNVLKILYSPTISDVRLIVWKTISRLIDYFGNFD